MATLNSFKLNFEIEQDVFWNTLAPYKHTFLGGGQSRSQGQVKVTTSLSCAESILVEDFTY